MVPAQLVALQELPLTANGKLDRSRLPAPETRRPRIVSDPPATAIEERLISIWRQVLGLVEIGRCDNFFELGGDSILSIQIVASAREHGLHFRVRDVFRYQTIAELAPHVQEAEARSETAAIEGTTVPLTPIQRWFFARDLEEPWHFNQSVMLRPRTPLEPDALRVVLQAIVKQHAALRLRFRQDGGRWIQEYGAIEGSLPLHVEDLTAFPPVEQSRMMTERATAWQRSLNLADGPLARVVLFQTSDGQRLLWTMHHLIVDGVSWRVLLEDLETVLDFVKRAAPPKLRPPSGSFEDFARFVQAYAVDAKLPGYTTYWSSLREHPPLPADFPKGAGTLASTTHVSVSLDAAETRALLEEVHPAYRLRTVEVLLTAVGLALEEWTRWHSFVVALEGHGRMEQDGAPDVSRTVGWFTALYPVLLSVPAVDQPAACLKVVKEALRSVPHEGLPYGVGYYLSGRELVPDVHPPVAFNYLGQFDQTLRKGLFELANESTGETHGSRGSRPYAIDIDAIVIDGRLQVSWSYSKNQFRTTTVESLALSFVAHLRSLIAHCQDPASAGYSPSDFPLAALPQEELDLLAARHGRNIAEIHPLSPMQHGLLFHTLLEPCSDAVYFEQITCRIDGHVQPDRMRNAWAALLDRHPMLRTAVHFCGQIISQIVYRDVTLPWQYEDWSHLGPEALEAFLAADRQRGFDLWSVPLMRLHLACLAEQRYQFTLSFHHALLDGWSLAILFEEFSRLLVDSQAALPQRVPYANYIEWLLEQDMQEARRYWSAYLDDFSTPTLLPGGRQISNGTATYNETYFSIDEQSAETIRRFAAEHRLTINTLLQAAWAALLSRYSGETDVAFGVTVSGRDIDLAGIDGIVGLLINTLPLRLRTEGSARVHGWLQGVQAAHQENARYGYLQLAEIQSLSPIPNGTPLFHSLLVFENYPVERSVSKALGSGLRFSEIRAVDRTNYPLTIVATLDKTLHFRIGYQTPQFDAGVIEQLFRHLRNLLLGISESDSRTTLYDLPLLDEEDCAQLQTWSREQQVPAQAQTLVEIFEAAARQHAQRTALVCEGTMLSYAELNRRADLLGACLRRLGARPDRIVALLANRSIQLVVGILGILKSGAGYLPIDPETPQARLAFMLADAGAIVVVTERSLLANLPPEAPPAVLLEGILAAEVETSDTAEVEASDTAALALQPQHLAYVIYTSGSTGVPKGVMVTHANVTRLFAVTQSLFQFSAGDVWTLLHSAAFDFSVWELWGALLYGGRLVVVPFHVSRDPVAFYDLLLTEQVTVLNQTPSAFRQLIPLAQQLRRPTPLRLVIFGGEALDLPALRPWFDVYGDAVPQLVNMYGITETTVHVTYCPISSADAECPARLIGRPLPDLSLYLLDPYRRPVPVGVAGEIYVGGVGLARGYLKRPQLTEERFVEVCVFGEQRRLYRSGDLGRWRADGTLEYIGRIDHQVKIRGYRLELGEIEAVITQHPNVREAAVVSAENESLAAYIVAGNNVQEAELRAWLLDRLPGYMVPSSIVFLVKLPLTVNGKVDRKALPRPHPQEQWDVAPRDEVEQRIASIWRDALGRAGFGVESTLFSLGGHSLTAMQIVARIYQTFGVKVPFQQFFEEPTIAVLAQHVRSSPAGTYVRIPFATVQPHYPLSHAQLQIWLDTQTTPAAAYNIPDAFEISEELDLRALRHAFEQLIARHEALRTGFRQVEGEPRQFIHEQVPLSIRSFDLRIDANFACETRRIIDAEAAAEFALEAPPLFRVTLIRQPGRRCMLVMVMHHIIGDGWTRNLLYHELSVLYAASRTGSPNPLPPVARQPKDFAMWQASLNFEAERQYWQTKLAGAPRHLDLPSDFGGDSVKSYRGSRVTLSLSSDLSEALRRIADSRKMTLSTVMLAIYKLLLFEITGQDDLCVAMVSANRYLPELEQMAGLFVNVLPIRTQISEETGVEVLLAQLQQTVGEALEKQCYPFDLLVRDLDRGDSAAGRPFLDAVYVFQSAASARLGLGTPVVAAPSPSAIQNAEITFGFARFALCFSVEDSGEQGIRLSLEYNSDRFQEGTTEGYLSRMEEMAGKLGAIFRVGRQA
jgi:amino acid adenylation domain-containing protein/non-ribosomal peptide synthase protein (TIGR01720 family)